MKAYLFVAGGQAPLPGGRYAFIVTTSFMPGRTGSVGSFFSRCVFIFLRGFRSFRFNLIEFQINRQYQ
ncbi:hypothetical protein HMPREF9413_3784 [Paenibacillus sp. HGF7]|nr:hypothetical protein HMPREF9413_3784 [Paenibacillus sp. HGF7]